MKFPKRFIPFFFVLVVTLCSIGQAADRFALVIGVDKYDHLPAKAQLNVAVSDARKMAATLEALNPPFDVSLLTDIEQDDAEEKIIEFKKQARGAECALVYFAGHGIEYHGENFLLVKNTDIGVASDSVSTMKRRLGNAALSLQALVDELDATGAQVKVVILDACRDNPLEVGAGGGTRSVLGGNSGLAQVTPPSGTLISYSADAGQQANDGLFTEILTHHLKTPGLPLPHVFALTRETVRARSLELSKNQRGVFHEPAEYTKLNLAGMKFSFSRGIPEKEGTVVENPEVVAMRKQMELMKQTIEELRKAGLENGTLKEQLVEMESNVAEAETKARTKPELAMPPPLPATIPSLPTGGFAAGTRSMEGSKPGEVLEFGGIEMVWCPPGELLMGSPEAEEKRDHDELQYGVTLKKGFWMAKTECSQGHWERMMGANPSEFKGMQLPVETVSWDDCQEWLAKMNEKIPLPDGWKWVLPTEAQWEYACRAGTESVFAFGNSLSGSQANFDGNYPYGGGAIALNLAKTAEVGSYRANNWGLLDMHGNVYEWCADRYAHSPSGPAGSFGSTESKSRVIRGGGWNRTAKDCRSAMRGGNLPDDHSRNLGFRPAISSAP